MQRYTFFDILPHAQVKISDNLPYAPVKISENIFPKTFSSKKIDYICRNLKHQKS